MADLETNANKSHESVSFMLGQLTAGMSSMRSEFQMAEANQRDRLSSIETKLDIHIKSSREDNLRLHERLDKQEDEISENKRAIQTAETEPLRAVNVEKKLWDKTLGEWLFGLLVAGLGTAFIIFVTKLSNDFFQTP